MVKSFKYRIYPTKKQEKLLDQTLYICRTLYNHALQHRIKNYKEHRINISYVDQNALLLKDKHEYELNVHSQVLQETLKRLDTSFKNFFRRIKERKAAKNLKVGFPRFKSSNRFKSFCYPQSGFRLTNDCKRIELSKIGTVKLKYSRDIQGKIKTCRVIRDIDKWYVVLTCEQNNIVPIKSTNPTIGIDVGIKTLAVLSDGKTIENPRHFKKSENKLAKVQRWLSRKVKGSKNRDKQRIVVARTHRKTRNQREDFLHKLSTKLVSEYGCIIFEQLNIRGMVRNHKLAKHISDCSWNNLISMTQYKAVEAGVEVKLVNPRNTSQMCSGCGEIVRKTLAERVHCCPHCGLNECRDLNAAKNIVRAGTAPIYAYGDSTSTQEHCVLGQVESLK